jgi:hypothetical protein
MRLKKKTKKMTKRKYKKYLNDRLNQINQLYIDSYKQEDKYFYEGMIEGLEHVRATL